LINSDLIYLIILLFQSHHELQQRIDEVKSEVAVSRAKLALKVKEVKAKRELLNATKKSLLADIRALAQVERDAM